MLRRSPKVATLEEKLTCPSCGYSLLGLQGTVVTCPECGTVCDRTALLMGSWQGPWHAVPGFSRLLMPLAWLSLGALVTLFALAWAANGALPPAAPVGSGLVAAGGWAVLLWSTRGVLHDGRGVLMSLLAHVLLAGYAAAVGVVAWSVIRAASAMGPTALLYGLPLVAGVVLFWGCRRGERFIASQCMREYLMRSARSGIGSALPRGDS